MTIARSLSLMLVAANLTACSSGGDSDDPMVPDSARFTELAAEANDLHDEHWFSTAESLPVSGSATFEGAAAYATQSEIDANEYDDLPPPNYLAVLADPSMVSEVTMTADFENRTIEGRMHDFEGAGGVEIDGELVVTNGQIYDNQGGFEADINGTLNADGVETTYSDGSNLGVSGHFSDDDDGQSVDAVFGEIVTVGTSATGEEENLHGVFTAER